MAGRQLNLLEVARELEMPPEPFVKIVQSASFGEALQALADCQRLVNRQRKRLARKYHPDLGGEASKMVRINQLCDLVQNLCLKPPRPRVTYRYFHSYVDYYAHSSTATTF